MNKHKVTGTYITHRKNLTQNPSSLQPITIKNSPPSDFLRAQPRIQIEQHTYSETIIGDKRTYSTTLKKDGVGGYLFSGRYGSRWANIDEDLNICAEAYAELGFRIGDCVALIYSVCMYVLAWSLLRPN